MKTLVVTAILLAVSPPARTQVALEAGATFTYQFDSLPRSGFIAAGAAPSGTLFLSLNPSTFDAGDMLRAEMFEDTTASTPICSSILTSLPSAAPVCSTFNGWQDLQGTVRFSMLDGSVTLNNFMVQVIRAEQPQGL